MDYYTWNSHDNSFVGMMPNENDPLNFQNQSNFYIEQLSQMTGMQQGNFYDFSLDPRLDTSNYNESKLPVGRSKRQRYVSKALLKQRQLRRNERERERQARLNSAFDVLRGAIPSFLAPYKNEQKLTQIETLRLAKYYILSLKELLDEQEKYQEEDKRIKKRTESE